ncbi:meiosis-specific with OB domain-containing protein [Macrosteles quadrilineatus]|uniref:meiosis-specific with OB domain-containing protein n=1 Tax=Macrosteles quadrilineatus TaxID=74068 RepID=UPI0023E19C33|nr:meiosis-specific with OB domain-containing protein [Macrosteles quadrilineatus]XP_054288215.1 meiosis-specific with OB domain-containing protein [Macrosteles quadrilineatus]
MAAGIAKTPIHALSHGSNEFFLVAIIIAKQSPRTISMKSDGSSRSVWNFTLRDSPAHYINVSFWGSPEFMENMARTFHIGDIVDIVKAKATYARDQDANFMPNVTSPLVLRMSEGISEMCLHTEQDCAELVRLLRLPTRPIEARVTLADIHHNSQALQGKYVNLLVVVSSVGAVRQINTKRERQIECREVEMMDNSCATCLTLQIWDSEVIYQADNWKRRETVLFIADVKLDWNNYRKRICAAVTGRTVITENPDCPEAIQQRNHARTAPTVAVAILDHLATNFADPASISTVMSCNTVYSKAVSGEFGDSFTALVYAAVIEFDLDGIYPLTATKCLQCQQLVDDSVGLCMNSECPVSSGLERPVTERIFDLRVSLADHTGSLDKCRMSSSAAAHMLNCTPDDFDLMSLDAKTALKWQYLFHRCASRLVILPATNNRHSPLLSIVAIEKVSLTEYAEKLPMY